MQTLWLNTCQALSDKLAWALADDSDSESDGTESEIDDFLSDTAPNSQSDIDTAGTVNNSPSVATNTNIKQVPVVEKGMSDHQLQNYLEFIVEQWASTNPSIRRIYIIFGYDIGLNIVDGMMGVIGQHYRMMKLPSGEWEGVCFKYWRAGMKLLGAGGSQFQPHDGLPGILDEDMDFWG